ncbi:hypothetical protein [Amycolatopsis sp. NPDC059657]|uniref:hypothetical protein n=1 Tax=Amycolatopsis sp. NPDC059657 TaxID=3346899 RepID=UPI00366A8C22
MRRRALQHGERGDLTVEVAIGASALILLFGLVLAAMRIETAEAAVDEAARSAARAASIARDGEAAAATARQRARDVLATQHLACAALDVAIDTRDFAQPLGETGYVTAVVTCEIQLSDLLIPGIGGARTASPSSDRRSIGMEFADETAASA